MREDNPLFLKVLVVSTVFMVALFVFFVGWMIYSAVKARDSEKQARAIKTPETPKAAAPLRDFSRFKTIAGEDGVEMVLIPSGSFLMGAYSDVDDDEKPRREVSVDAFYIDMFEVTNEQYKVFMKATGHRRQEIPFFQADVSVLMGPAQPAVGVSWQDAKDYCDWIGKRLPTEAEWEKAARGEVGWVWPWGNTFEKGYANIGGDEDGFRYSAPVGQFEAGRSPYGLYDMAGNVSEWVWDWYDDRYYRRAPLSSPKGPDIGRFKVYRGGSWNDFSGHTRATKRFAAFIHRTDAIIGFRCAKDAKN